MNDVMFIRFSSLYAISAYHHTFGSFIPSFGALYLILLYVIMFVNLWKISRIFSANKIDCNNITEILLKVVLNTHDPHLYVNIT